VLSGSCGTTEGHLDGCHGGVGRDVEGPLHPAVVDDEAGGHEGIQIGLI
jgi:hypothetical protein